MKLLIFYLFFNQSLDFWYFTQIQNLTTVSSSYLISFLNPYCKMTKKNRGNEMTKKLLDLIETDFCSHKTKHRFTRKDIERLKSCKENLQKCMMPCHATINNAFLTCFYYSDNKIISSSKFWQQIVRLDEF